MGHYHPATYHDRKRTPIRNVVYGQLYYFCDEEHDQ